MRVFPKNACTSVVVHQALSIALAAVDFAVCVCVCVFVLQELARSTTQHMQTFQKVHPLEFQKRLCVRRAACVHTAQLTARFDECAVWQPTCVLTRARCTSFAAPRLRAVCDASLDLLTPHAHAQASLARVAARRWSSWATRRWWRACAPSSVARRSTKQRAPSVGRRIAARRCALTRITAVSGQHRAAADLLRQIFRRSAVRSGALHQLVAEPAALRRQEQPLAQEAAGGPGAAAVAPPAADAACGGERRRRTRHAAAAAARGGATADRHARRPSGGRRRRAAAHGVVSVR